MIFLNDDRSDPWSPVKGEYGDGSLAQGGDDEEEQHLAIGPHRIGRLGHVEDE